MRVIQRGVRLVDEVIRRIEQSGEGISFDIGDPALGPVRMPPSDLERLTLNGKPLPPSLRHWLGYDMRALHLFDDLSRPRLRPLTFLELLDEEFGDVYEVGNEQAWAEQAHLLTADCYLLPGGSDSRTFLYAGEADEHGEYPVMLVDTDEMPWACVYAPGIDVFLAEQLDLLPEFESEDYLSLARYEPLREAMEWHARANFGGFLALGDPDTVHVDDED